MKKIIVFVLLLFTSIFVWGQNQNILEGVWIYEEETELGFKYFFAFIGNMYFGGGFRTDMFDIEEVGNYTYNNDTGKIEFAIITSRPAPWDIDFFSADVNLNNNNLLLRFDEFDNRTYTFRKRIAPSAPEAIAGVWRGGSLQWIVAFIQNLVFIISEDQDYLDTGNYIFDGNRGSFNTIEKDLTVDFSFRDNLLVIEIDNGNF